ncbi:major facilitator superfamily domain-containing protein [Cyathus striatus]|nr:major facilitator superfamily domain-containing protein [Cyathus striatus]
MPSEPVEAILAYPPILTPEQEEQFRTLEQEGGPLSRHTTLHELEQTYTRTGYHVVTFDKGKGEDPREWSKFQKWYITIGTAFLCLAAALGSSLITGDMRGPATEFGAKQIIINLTVTCFVMGFGIGPLFFAPLSEVFGRRPMYIVSMFFFFIFTLPSALAKNAATLVVARQIAGIAASAPVCNVGGSIADVWSVEERGAPMAVFSATLFVGPCLGPMLGGWIGERAGWRWMYWVLFTFLGACCFVTLFIPETLAPILLKRKAERLRKETGDEKYRTLEELERKTFSETLKVALIRPFVMLLCEPIVLFMSFYLSFVYSLLYLMFFAFPIAFEEIRGFGMGITGITFVSIMLGIFIAMIGVPYQEKIYARATRNGTFPEARLYPMMVGSVFPVSLFIFAFTGAYPWVHWIAPCIAGCLFGFGMISSTSPPTHTSSTPTPISLQQPWLPKLCGVLLALVGCAIGPMPFIFYKYGGAIRARSKRASPNQRIKDEDVVGEKKMSV